MLGVMFSAKKVVFAVVSSLIISAMGWLMMKSTGEPTTLYLRTPTDVVVFLDDKQLRPCTGKTGCVPPEEGEWIQYRWGIFSDTRYIVEARRGGTVVGRVQIEAKPGEAPSVLLDDEGDWVEAAPPERPKMPDLGALGVDLGLDGPNGS